MPLSHSGTSLPLLACIHLDWQLSPLRMEHFKHKQAMFGQQTRWKVPLTRSHLQSANE
jgi:hypothetical protein